MKWQIPLSDIDFGPEEKKAVEDVLDSRWLTMGTVTQEFEQAFAAYVGAKYAVAVTNATAALHLACVTAGLGPGDEALVPSLTFVATANAIRYTGAAPVFVDIMGEQDLNVSYRSMEKAITKRTKAILVMHYGGYACDMPSIMELAREHDLRVIEDAAHAIGSELEGRKLGTCCLAQLSSGRKLGRLTWLLWVLMCHCPSPTRAIHSWNLQSPTGHSSFKVRGRQGKQMQGMPA
jgi:dTDP-4-amino-4,6-dideoxygalactose transaminase